MRDLQCFRKSVCNFVGNEVTVTFFDRESVWTLVVIVDEFRITHSSRSILGVRAPMSARHCGRTKPHVSVTR